MNIDTDSLVSLEMFTYCYSQETECSAWDMWIAKLPWMGKDDFISFEDFLGKKAEPKQKPTDSEILKELTDLVSAFEGRQEAAK